MEDLQAKTSFGGMTARVHDDWLVTFSANEDFKVNGRLTDCDCRVRSYDEGLTWELERPGPEGTKGYVSSSEPLWDRVGQGERAMREKGALGNPPHSIFSPACRAPLEGVLLGLALDGFADAGINNLLERLENRRRLWAIYGWGNAHYSHPATDKGKEKLREALPTEILAFARTDAVKLACLRANVEAAKRACKALEDKLEATRAEVEMLESKSMNLAKSYLDAAKALRDTLRAMGQTTE
jgi:hypothetical protein